MSGLHSLADRETRETIGFHPSPHAAERELAEIVHDDPEWKGRYEVVIVDFSGSVVRVCR